MDKSIKVFAPATVANVGPGYDVLGLALDNIGDYMELTLNDLGKITILMSDPDLPTDPEVNVAGVAARALLDHLESKKGVNIKIHKNVKAGSGLGSSASSAAGAVYGVNELLGQPLSKLELVPFAMAGETASSGKAHADNVAPSLLGGFTLVRSYNPLDVIKLSYPTSLYVAAVHPHIEVKTADSKKMLKKEISLELAVAQWGNLAGFVSGLASNDFNLISRSLEDLVVEPIRSMLIPGFESLKKAANINGALGCSISGSGPSVFALCESKSVADKIGTAFKSIYNQLDINHDIHISQINPEGCKILDPSYEIL
ncbi:homoserine kinase [Fulvivirga sp.]|uniref:homoserine kinase n=1 Tax=Fulvivirga sp. TaxID=1931237 RepID=UPI0032EF1DA8